MRTFMSLFLLSVFAMLTGCAKNTSGDEPAQAKVAVEGHAAIIGKWTVDPDRLAKQPQFAEMPAEQRKLSLDMARNVVRSMSFEFTKDHFNLTMAGKPIEGSYTVKTETPTHLVLELTETDGRTNTLEVDILPEGLTVHPAENESLPLIHR